MVKKISKSAQLKSKLNKAIINTIVSMGGRASRKDIIAAIENSKIFDAWESEVLPSNKRRWRTAFDIQSNELVKLGRIVKQNGVWEIFNEVEPNYILSNLMHREAHVPNEAKPALPLYFISPKDIEKLEGGNVHASDETLFDDLIEPPWMQIFRGKTNPQSDDLAGNKAKLLRNAFLTYERKKEIETIDINKKFDDFRERLSAIGNLESEIHKAKKDLSWWALIKLMLALILGLIVGMMLPMQFATRSGEGGLIHKILFKEPVASVSTHLEIHNKNPLDFSHDIINSALEDGLEISITGESEYVITIRGLRSYKQLATKIKIGLPPDLEGSAEVLITP